LQYFETGVSLIIEGLEVQICGSSGTVNVCLLLPLCRPHWKDADGFNIVAAARFSLLHSLLVSSAQALLFLALQGSLPAR
jgi:hypothetical protein